MIVVCERELPPGASTRLSPAERKLRAKLAANARWSKPMAREDQAEASRRALIRRFEKQVDPAQELAEEERERLAKNAAKTHSARMNMAKIKKGRES